MESNTIKLTVEGGNNIVIYYDTNSWNFTRIGKVDGVSTRKEMLDLLGGTGKISVTLSLE